jgi:CMP-N,N'-diacetyllegionaminic acid synthase
VRTLGVITARGGSKGIPGKNLKLLAGRPLLAYTVEAALESGVFDRLILSTDDPAIADAARGLGCEVPFLRPAELARDDTPHLPVMQHALQWVADHEDYRPDLVMILQPTSPLRQPHHIREAVALMATSPADSVVSVCAVPSHYHPMNMIAVDAAGEATLFVTGGPLRTRVKRRQDLPPVWVINGAIYLFHASALRSAKPSQYGMHSAAYVMSERYSINIDSLDDWEHAERILQSTSQHG